MIYYAHPRCTALPWVRVDIENPAQKAFLGQKWSVAPISVITTRCGAILPKQACVATTRVAPCWLPRLCRLACTQIHTSNRWCASVVSRINDLGCNFSMISTFLERPFLTCFWQNYIPIALVLGLRTKRCTKPNWPFEGVFGMLEAGCAASKVLQCRTFVHLHLTFVEYKTLPFSARKSTRTIII